MQIYFIGKKTVMNKIKNYLPYLNIPIIHLKDQADFFNLNTSHTNIYIIWKKIFQTQSDVRKQCKKIRSLDRSGEIIVLSTKHSNEEAIKLYETQAKILAAISLNKSLDCVFDELYDAIQYIVKKEI